MNENEKKLAEKYENMTEEEIDERIEELLEINRKQEEILRKQGQGRPKLEMEDGKIVIDINDPKQRKIWDE
ncbi:putative transcriptional regulator [Salibacterium salarium]|uniref:Uncharacterized protein n=1 Tax=Salibacterium salarium TaxID=284579 RepID=A0A3R9RBK7_9BACI|nr:hypothetical protein [Salibacterium salarium]MDQ0300443.1 putative transcriptional regulator [Salibacterium salarium]RSL31719.1 hypothetical protein D7Z54_18985 [Salibacterium salarium]